MITRLLILSCLFASTLSAQQVTRVYKTDGLLQRIGNADTVFVVNFWATWCKPCVQELPSFDSLMTATKSLPVKLLLVSLDFKEELDKKVNPFLQKNNIRIECVLLDEINGNDFINKISPQWSGAIPATLFKHGSATQLAEKKMHLNELQEQLKKFTN